MTAASSLSTLSEIFPDYHNSKKKNQTNNISITSVWKIERWKGKNKNLQRLETNGNVINYGDKQRRLTSSVCFSTKALHEITN